MSLKQCLNVIYRILQMIKKKSDVKYYNLNEYSMSQVFYFDDVPLI